VVAPFTCSLGYRAFPDLTLYWWSDMLGSVLLHSSHLCAWWLTACEQARFIDAWVYSMKHNTVPLVISLASTALALACAAILILVLVHGYHANSATALSTTHGGVQGGKYSAYPHQPLTVQEFDPTSPIALENAQAGTTAWEIDPTASTTFIQGYAGATTALPGASVALYISSQRPTTFAVDVYRIGWYHGKGGRLYLHQAGVQSLAQGTWQARGWTSLCATCVMNPTTHLLEAHWKVTTHITIGANWLSGVYLIKLTAANHAESYIPLVVRSPAVFPSGQAPAPFLADIPFNTYQAYNLWGGFSLYGNTDNEGFQGSRRAVKVSFDRPYDRSAGAGDFLAWDIHIVRWMERADLNVTYTADDALAAALAQPQQHAILMLGHGEYWTKAMRDGLEQARDAGINLAFLGADDGYWQARYEPDAAGTLNRTLVCYKVSTKSSPQAMDALALDPDYPAHPELVTALWRDPVLHRPESELLGLEYRSIIGHNYYPAWIVAPGPVDPLAQGTEIAPGMAVTGGLLGYEFDGFGLKKYSPTGLHVLAASPVMTRYHLTFTAVTAYYRAASGALVFDAGSIWWAWGLDESSPPGAYQANILRGSQPINQLTFNIIAAMAPASPIH
jgi:hypothetical protein